MTKLSVDLGKNIRFVRKLRGMTQKELADRVGLKACAISFFETGNRTPTIRNLILLCEGLDCRSDYLLFKTSSCDIR